MIRSVLLKSGDVVYRVRVGNGPMKTFSRKRDAEEWEAKQRQARLRNRAGLDPLSVETTTFGHLCELYQANFIPSKWKLDILDYSKTKWSRHTLQEMHPEQIGAWLHGLPYAPKTKSHIITVLRGVLDAAVEWGYLTRNPARSRSFKAPSTKRVRPIRPFESWEEVVKAATFVARQGEMVSDPLIRFACATGVRVPGELMAIRWVDIDWGEKTLSVRGTKTDAATRTIPLSDHAMSALLNVPRSLNRQDIVWKNQHLKVLSYINWRDTDWRDGLVEAGLEHRTPYEMRHTFATLALGAGAAIDDVASVMGHTDIDEVYRFYRKWIPQSRERLRAVLNTIGKENDGTQSSPAEART